MPPVSLRRVVLLSIKLKVDWKSDIPEFKYAISMSLKLKEEIKPLFSLILAISKFCLATKNDFFI